MKKIYSTIIFIAFVVAVFGQSARIFSLNHVAAPTCKSCTPNTLTVLDTFCNIESNDQIVAYYIDAKTPIDSGWVTGMNFLGDMGWAERYAVSGNATVLGGAYMLYEKSGAATSGGTAMGKVYSISSVGKPNTALATANIPFANMALTAGGLTFFTFSTPVAVSDSFFMAFEFNAYTLGGPDTITIMTTRYNDRSTSNNNQNCAKWSDGTWKYERTENFGNQCNYMLCTVMNIPSGVENFVSKGDLQLYAAYPSPASNDVAINYSLVNAAKTSIEIFDTQGKSVLKLDKGNLSAGTHLEKIDVSSFATGTYFYRVSTERGTLFSQFVVGK